MSQLDQLAGFVGGWIVGSPQFPGAEGHATFAWFDGDTFLVQRVAAADPAPDSTWMIGGDDADEHLTALYADSRGVTRVYRMHVTDHTWAIWRDASGFSQRFTGTISVDGTSIMGAWEWSSDGITWEHDFELAYAQVPWCRPVGDTRHVVELVALAQEQRDRCVSKTLERDGKPRRLHR